MSRMKSRPGKSICSVVIKLLQKLSADSFALIPPDQFARHLCFRQKLGAAEPYRAGAAVRAQLEPHRLAVVGEAAGEHDLAAVAARDFDLARVHQRIPEAG